MKAATAASRVAARQKEAIARLEAIVQRDEGGRGIEHLCRPPGELERIARCLKNSDNVALLTGFPCVENANVPTETDGPSGTIAMCSALLRSNENADVRILTDECNAQVMESCARERLPRDGRWRLNIFPPQDNWSAADQRRLEDIAGWSDHILALERVSAGPDGFAHTASGRVMGSDLVAPLDQLFGDKMRALNTAYSTTCVGDGGNELGMGTVGALVRKHVKNGDVIVSGECADFLLACSVSNWGGYAIAGALQVLSDSDDQLLPTCEEETRSIQAAIDAGAHDGLLMTRTLSVDGLNIDVHCAILDELRKSIQEGQDESR